MPTTSQRYPELLPGEGEPVWELARRLYPPQGAWSEEEFLNLSDNSYLEFVQGRVESLTMPTEYHQLIVARLYDALHAFVALRNLGLVLFAGLKVRVAPQKVRQPDIAFLTKANYGKRDSVCWNGADLVVEIVSDGPSDRTRDFETKRQEYAQAGIAEYWIVDAQEKRVLVLKLENGAYVQAGAYAPGQKAASALLPGFEVDVEAVFKTE